MTVAPSIVILYRRCGRGDCVGVTDRGVTNRVYIHSYPEISIFSRIYYI